MGLDIYVGSYSRYFTGNWENIVQQRGREEGWDVHIVRPANDEDAITDPKVVRPAVLEWRNSISEGLGDNLKEQLDWDESDDAPYFTDKPAWDGYGSLLLWAAYSEHPELTRPAAATEDWDPYPAFQKSVESASKLLSPPSSETLKHGFLQNSCSILRRLISRIKK